MARCAVRAAYQRRNVWRDDSVDRNSFRPLCAGGDPAVAGQRNVRAFITKLALSSHGSLP